MNSSDQIQVAIRHLQKGDLVGIPTETVYGLAARISDPIALKKVFELKQRPFFDPLIVHVSSKEMAKQLVTSWPKLADFLVDTFWPGPLSLVLPKSKQVSDLISSGLETVALRMPDQEMTLQLITEVGPLAAPSANIFGRTSPTLAEHVRAEFGERLFVLDGGPCKGGIESTVLQIQTDDTISILRPGLITIEMIQAAAKEKLGKEFKVHSGDEKKSPGHLEHHYMPKTPLVLVDGKKSNSEISNALSLQNFNVDESELIIIPLSENPTLAARELYSLLRNYDRRGKALVVFKNKTQNSGLWTAIFDRLTRAATFKV